MPARPEGDRAGVQSIQRTFRLLEVLSESGGTMSLSGLAETTGLPLPTIHRLLRTLVELGYLRQEPSRAYALGPRLIPLGERSARLLGEWARPILSRLVQELEESANLAMLDGDSVVYVGQVPSRHSMRMFTEVGRRVLPHCTAVGKALLADAPAPEVRALITRTGMPPQTPHTITDPDVFAAALAQTRDDGFALDDGEQELGVRCVAVAVPQAPTRLAISISGPTARMDEAAVHRAVPLLQAAAAELARDLG